MNFFPISFYFFGIGPEYILVIIAAIISMVAQNYVTSTYNRYRKVRTLNGYTGAQIARKILDANGLHDVTVIESGKGTLSDHYDPAKKTVALSRDIYQNDSIASVAVASHEVGHAIQHAQAYGFIGLRNKVLPLAIISSQFGMFFLIAGLILGGVDSILFIIGIIALTIVAIFQLVTLPVEFNASKRALNILDTQGYLTRDEVPHARKMLQAAALTYVAALVGTILNVLYYVSLGNRRRD